MPHYDSPLGSKKIAAAPLKEFDVPDESGYVEPTNPIPTAKQRTISIPNEDAIQSFQSRMEDNTATIEQEVRQAREAKRTGKERLNEGAKRRAEMLLGMTRSFREFKVGEYVFVLQSLKSKEARDAFVAA